jgi:hypothetical protein
MLKLISCVDASISIVCHWQAPSPSHLLLLLATQSLPSALIQLKVVVAVVSFNEKCNPLKPIWVPGDALQHLAFELYSVRICASCQVAPVLAELFHLG